MRDLGQKVTTSDIWPCITFRRLSDVTGIIHTSGLLGIGMVLVGHLMYPVSVVVRVVCCLGIVENTFDQVYLIFYTENRQTSYAY